MAAPRTIAIAGAGIGGLTLALALASRGFRSIVLEKSETLDAAGAGIQLSPNASRILIELGLEPQLSRSAVALNGVSIMSARSGRELARVPLEGAAFRYGAPYWIVHRADLQSALLAQAMDHPDIELRLGCQFDDLATHARGVTVVHRQGNMRGQDTVQGLIGADGIWSSVRRHLFPDVRPTFSGRIAWRGMIDASQVPRDFREARVQLWMGANAHLVAYPVSGGRQINIVAIIRSDWNRPGWSEPGDAAEIGRSFEAPKWPKPARLLIGAVESWRRWALYSIKDGGVWNDGPVALLGDAAHAMLPFAAQGAGMAIEDAMVLAESLTQTPGNIPAALATYGARRQGRLARVQRHARRNGQLYHWRWPMALLRDIGIRALGGDRLLARQDWIYDQRFN